MLQGLRDERCNQGVCTACATDLTLCGNTCIDLTTDVANCGACNKTCATGQKCVNSACVTPV